MTRTKPIIPDMDPPVADYFRVCRCTSTPCTCYNRTPYITTTSHDGPVIWDTAAAIDMIEKRHPTEIRFPRQCGTFRELIEKSYTTHLIKNQDYSPANITIMGENGVLVRIWDKFCRICNLKGIPFPCVGPDIKELQSKIGTLTHEQIYDELEKIAKKSEFDFSTAKEKKPAVKDEALEDTWLDLMTYAIIGNIFRKGNWGR